MTTNLTTCSIADCDDPVRSRGWCEKHYIRWRRNGDPLLVKTPHPTLSDEEYEKWFWSKTKRDGDCLIWIGKKHKAGYGNAQRHGVMRAHRVAHMITKGAIPDGFEVRHLCHNPSCCNPDHLAVGSHRDNMQDMALADRSGNKKLTSSQVTEIHRRGAAMNWRYGTQSNLAREFGVTLSVIHNIRSGKTVLA